MTALVDPKNAQRFLNSLLRRGTAHLEVTTGSMRPFVLPGDILFVRRVDTCDIAVGQIVVFENEGSLLTHRVIGKVQDENQTRLITKGDASRWIDSPLSAREWMARAVRLYRGDRCINLDTPWQNAIGRIVAVLSSSSHVWFPVVRAGKRCLCP